MLQKMLYIFKLAPREELEEYKRRADNLLNLTKKQGIYITELQEENKRLKLDRKELYKKIEEGFRNE